MSRRRRHGNREDSRLFLRRSVDEVARMHGAWFKAVTAHVTRWTRRYVEPEND